MSHKNLVVSLTNGVRTILINRPEKKNAMKREMSHKLAEILNEDAKNDKIVVTIITGAGEYFSSGNDINSAMEEGEMSVNVVKNLVQALIDYPKIIIAVINGPAIGIGATLAAVCDIVYASDKTYFDTPFIPLGFCTEGAASYTFPKTLGRSKASEMLFLNKKLSAQEAYNFGLVAEVIPHENIDAFIKSLYKYGSLSINSVKVNKELIMRNLRKTLTECNEREIEALAKCAESEECLEGIMMFMKRKSKL